MKRNQSICSSTIEGTKKIESIRSSTIDDLTLLLPPPPLPCVNKYTVDTYTVGGGGGLWGPWEGKGP